MACRGFLTPNKEWARNLPASATDDEKNWRHLERWTEDLVKNCLGGSSAQVYCAWGVTDYSEDGGNYSPDDTIVGQDITLTARSTIGIWLSANTQADGTPHTILGRVRQSTFQTRTPALGSTTTDGDWEGEFFVSVSTNSATTRNAGDYTYVPHFQVRGGGDLDTVSVHWALVLVVGANTEDDCLEGIE